MVSIWLAAIVAVLGFCIYIVGLISAKMDLLVGILHTLSTKLEETEYEERYGKE